MYLNDLTNCSVSTVSRSIWFGRFVRNNHRLYIILGTPTRTHKETTERQKPRGERKKRIQRNRKKSFFFSCRRLMMALFAGGWYFFFYFSFFPKSRLTWFDLWGAKFLTSLTNSHAGKKRRDLFVQGRVEYVQRLWPEYGSSSSRPLLPAYFTF